MPEFTTEIEIDPSEFVDSCSRREKEELAEILLDEGYVSSLKSNNNHGVRRPNMNDEIFWESLEQLKKCRDLLSIHEENYINNMANKYKHLR